MLRWTAITSLVAWALANGLDVATALFVVQSGFRFAFAHHYPGEVLIIYAGLRLLGTMAVGLMALCVVKRWPQVARLAWGLLTVCAIATAAGAWLRVMR